ncbi:dienelactone hydrolase [Coprinopsis cinerea okayama7|uniref:Dienelactone hydrolase n=1 Tax=Coprinopsis cinerea (strain Okayama-7 / 130 / ATCC MYA-4618 / FGSC 9003) TaxID=240176 RepID=A8NA50_COPC7|nr:dienelactone hydrolase [Coprinopsis cinerea okayama7\|eukprot:XP_001831706.1 dienelactone hydrolase [Coprinopsis cinerea okayama7\
MSSNTGFCADCVKGVRHEGTPTGKWETIGGVQSYVATPEGDYPKDKVILYLADVFGPQLPNAQTVIPDYLNGDPIPADGLNPGSTFDLMKWLASHGKEQTRPPLDKVINALKEQGVKTFGAVGYCFGGRYVFDLAFENIISVAVANHPTFVQAPEDIEKYLTLSKAPLLINSCEFDERFPIEAQAITDSILGDGKFAPGYKRTYWEGCTHGFAVRGDLSNPKVKAGKEGAFDAAVKWFKEKL